MSMNINVTLDLNDFTDLFSGESLEKALSDEFKSEIMKIVKKDPRYKAFINKKALEALSNLNV